MRLPLARRHVAAGHVPPDEDSLAVAMPVPAFGFDLDMFADHIESQLLREPDVVEQRLVGRGPCRGRQGHQPLVERAEMEERPAVERHAFDTVGVAPGGDLAQRGVGFGTVDHLPSVAQERHGPGRRDGGRRDSRRGCSDGEVHRLPGHAASPRPTSCHRPRASRRRGRCPCGRSSRRPKGRRRGCRCAS